MNTVFVIGNGTSRRDFNLNLLKTKGTVIGCNDLYKDYPVDYLIACDLPVAKEIISTGYNNSCKFYTREQTISRLNYPAGVFVFPDLPEQGDKKFQKSDSWGSGLYATYLACLGSYEKIILLGFDLDGYEDKTKNNMYNRKLHIPGTKTERPVDASFWIKQFELLFNWYPQKEFTFIHHDNWKNPESWSTIENFKRDNYKGLETFLEVNS